MSAKPSKIYFRAQQGKKPSTGERSELRRNGWPRSGIGMAGMNKNFWRPRRTDDQKWHDFIWGFPKVFHIFAILSFFLVYSFWNFVKNLHVVFYWKFPKLFFFSPKHFATPKNARTSPFDGFDFCRIRFNKTCGVFYTNIFKSNNDTPAHNCEQKLFGMRSRKKKYKRVVKLLKTTCFYKTMYMSGSFSKKNVSLLISSLLLSIIFSGREVFLRRKFFGPCQHNYIHFQIFY